MSIIKTSCFLEELHVSYIIDAQDFLQHPALNHQETGGWESLKVLTLTAGVLRSTSATGPYQLLLAAAIVAKKMPRLALLELWDWSRGNTAIFRYHRTESKAKMTWQGTWIMKMDGSVLQAWQEVALQHGDGRYELDVDITQFEHVT